MEYSKKKSNLLNKTVTHKDGRTGKVIAIRPAWLIQTFRIKLGNGNTEIWKFEDLNI